LSDGVSIEEIRSGIDELELMDEDGNCVNSEVLRIIAESLGYDGIIDSTVSKKFNMNLSEDTSHIIAFNSNQIKSATDNIGTFDSANDDIRFSIKADTRTQEEKDALNQKFRDLYEQYKNGTIDVRQEALSSKDLLQDPDNYGDNEAFKQSLEIVSKLDLPRTAKTFDEAKEAIKDIIGKEITNKSDGFIATVSMSSVKKMLSKSAVSKSISPEAQAYAVANIDALFENSERLESKQDRAEDRNVKAIHRYYTPMYFNGEVCAVKITVKELVNSENNRIYSVESIDIKKASEQSVEANLQADG
jgi:hypothetical protein